MLTLLALELRLSFTNPIPGMSMSFSVILIFLKNSIFARGKENENNELHYFISKGQYLKMDILIPENFQGYTQKSPLQAQILL